MQKIKQKGDESGFDLRISTDLSSERLQSKIKSAIEMKVPYILVCGEKEVSSGLFDVRYFNKEIGKMSRNEFISRLLYEARHRK